jgi:hypothetical protein
MVKTLGQFSKPMLADTTLCVRKEELEAYQDTYANLGLKFLSLKKVSNIGETRRAIANQVATSEFVMMDDDLRFCVRRKDEPDKFTLASTGELTACVGQLEKLLKKYAHAGVLAREGANRVTESVVYATRMMRVLGYRTAALRNSGARFDRCPPMEDFDVTLTLLRQGLPNAVLCNWAQDQGSSNAPGGCSEQRTLEGQANTARKLAALHVGFVKVVEKTTKTAWGGATRLDVQVAWKKALASSSGRL